MEAMLIGGFLGGIIGGALGLVIYLTIKNQRTERELRERREAYEAKIRKKLEAQGVPYTWFHTGDGSRRIGTESGGPGGGPSKT
jgi:hypothetical protein